MRAPDEWSGDQWVKGRKEAFREWATSDTFPRWLRVTFAAYSKLEANGHAVFRQQELAGILGEEIDHAWVPTIRQRVREAIDGAIDRGLLEPDSKALCLIVPRSAVLFAVGDPAAPCRRHPNKRNGRTVSPGHQTTRFQPVVSLQRERQKRVVSRSTPLSSIHPNQRREPDMPRRNRSPRLKRMTAEWRREMREAELMTAEQAPDSYDRVARLLVRDGKASHAVLGIISDREAGNRERRP